MQCKWHWEWHHEDILQNHTLCCLYCYQFLQKIHTVSCAPHQQLQLCCLYLMLTTSSNGFSSQSSLPSSINHCRKSVSAICSRVLFWRWSRSILSSKLLNTSAMAFCSGSGGRFILIKSKIFVVIVSNKESFIKYNFLI